MSSIGCQKHGGEKSKKSLNFKLEFEEIRAGLAFDHVVTRVDAFKWNVPR